MVSVILKRVYEKGKIVFELPSDFYTRQELHLFFQEMKKHDDYMTVSFSKPTRKRSTGKGSQNHHLNGHIIQICNETGNDYAVIKYCVKMLAVEKLGYPYKQYNEHIIPKEEKECNTEECIKLIEAVHYLASDMGIVLREE